MKSEQFALHAEIEEKHWWFLGRRRIVTELVSALLPDPSGQLIVDVGCGTGGNIGSLAGAYAGVGVDSSAEAIELAKQRYPATRFACGLVPEAIEDVVGRGTLFLLMDVIEHVPDDFLFFSKLFSAARPGTLFLITVPADRSLWGPHDVSFGHYRRYDPERLRLVWKGLPAKELLLSHFNARLYPVAKIVRTLSRSRGQALGKAGTDFRFLPAVDRLFENLMASEGKVLRELLEGKRRFGFARGVSLIAVVRREAGEAAVRRKPAGLPPDMKQEV